MSNEVSSSLDRVVSSISTAKIKMKNISIRLTNAAEDQYIENVRCIKAILIEYIESLKASLNLRLNDIQD